MIGYSIRIKGVAGFIKELTLHPFHSSTLPCKSYWFHLTCYWKLIALVAKPFSLALRLFGNLYAGELDLYPDWYCWFDAVTTALYLGCIPHPGYCVTSLSYL